MVKDRGLSHKAWWSCTEDKIVSFRLTHMQPVQIKGVKYGLLSLPVSQAYLFPIYRLPVNQILGCICFTVNSVLLKILLHLFCYWEVNAYNTAGARKGTKRLSYLWL